VPDDRVASTVSVQPDRIDLGETATLSLAVEGPRPLRVEMPTDAQKLLTTKSALMWQIKPLGTPRTSLQDGGRERWEQTFRLSPFFHGDRVSVAFNSLNVNGAPLTFEAQSIRVRKTLDEAAADKAVPVTGIEAVATAPPPPADASGWPFLAALAGIFAAVVVAAIVRKRRAKPPPIPPLKWATGELDRLERDVALERTHPRTGTDRLAGILREFTERRFGIPATRLTTSELRAACDAAEWPSARAESLRDLLEPCDRAKFAGETPDANTALTLILAARAWLAGIEPPP